MLLQEWDVINTQTREQQQKLLNQSRKYFTLGDPQKGRSLTTLQWGKAPQEAESLGEIAVTRFSVHSIPNLDLSAHLCTISACWLKSIPKTACCGIWTKLAVPSSCPLIQSVSFPCWQVLYFTTQFTKLHRCCSVNYLSAGFMETVAEGGLYECFGNTLHLPTQGEERTLIKEELLSNQILVICYSEIWR